MRAAFHISSIVGDPILQPMQIRDLIFFPLAFFAGFANFFDPHGQNVLETFFGQNPKDSERLVGRDEKFVKEIRLWIYFLSVHAPLHLDSAMKSMDGAKEGGTNINCRHKDSLARSKQHLRPPLSYSFPRALSQLRNPNLQCFCIDLP